MTSKRSARLKQAKAAWVALALLQGGIFWATALTLGQGPAWVMACGTLGLSGGVLSLLLRERKR